MNLNVKCELNAFLEGELTLLFLPVQFHSYVSNILHQKINLLTYYLKIILISLEKFSYAPSEFPFLEGHSSLVVIASNSGLKSPGIFGLGCSIFFYEVSSDFGKKQWIVCRIGKTSTEINYNQNLNKSNILC